MTEPWLAQPPLVAWARRQFAISSAGPVTVFLVVVTALVLHGRPGTEYVVGAFVCLIVLLIIAWLNYWMSFNHPDHWIFNSSLASYFAAAFFLLMTLSSPKERRFGLDTPIFSVVVGVLTVGIVLLGWLPARRGARMILDDLLYDDVVNSSLVISFTSRVRGTDVLDVTPDSLAIVRPKASGKAHRSYPLTDVSAIIVRTEHHEREYPLPGIKGRNIRVNGEVVVIELPAGQLVFPVKEPRRFMRFVEERRAALVNE